MEFDIKQHQTEGQKTSLKSSLRAGSTLSPTRERLRAKRSGGKESGEEATPRALMLQREPARRLT